jgi:hypothetical protein
MPEVIAAACGHFHSGELSASTTKADGKGRFRLEWGVSLIPPAACCCLPPPPGVAVMLRHDAMAMILPRAQCQDQTGGGISFKKTSDQRPADSLGVPRIWDC